MVKYTSQIYSNSLLKSKVYARTENLAKGSLILFQFLLKGLSGAQDIKEAPL